MVDSARSSLGPGSAADPQGSAATPPPAIGALFVPASCSGTTRQAVAVSEKTIGPVTAVAHELPADRFLERELSWLVFNEHALELAASSTLPLLERVRYVAIFASNLDEFYMVHVAGQQRRSAMAMARVTVAGFEPSEILAEIHKRTAQYVERHAQCFAATLRPLHAAQGIRRAQWCDLDGDAVGAATAYFWSQVSPVITPLTADPAHPFPYISGRSRNLAVVLCHQNGGALHFTHTNIPQSLPRLCTIRRNMSTTRKQQHNIAFMPIEGTIAQHLPELCSGMKFVEHHCFRVGRDADLEVKEDDAESPLSALKQELARRCFRAAVQLEVKPSAPDRVAELLTAELHVQGADIFRVRGPFNLTRLDQICNVEASELRFKPCLLAPSQVAMEGESSRLTGFFGTLLNRDLPRHHPYNYFSTSVQEFLRQAANYPTATANKQTLHPPSGNSPIVHTIIDAAAASNQVLARIELKARFDGQANITWACTLEYNGVHDVHGVVGRKTDPKLRLVVHQAPHNLQRYCYVGTGNFNPKTAWLYEDVGLLSPDADIVEDVAQLFTGLPRDAPETTFTRLLVASPSLRSGLKKRRDGEAEGAGSGDDTWTKIKINSLVGEVLDDALRRASIAIMGIDIIVRGICALRPGVLGFSANTSLRAILARFLEHARVSAFGGGGSPQAWIGAAALMHRTVDRLVEAALRLRDPAHVQAQLRLLSLTVSPNTAPWHLDATGTWVRHHVDSDGAPLRDVQQCLIESRARKVPT